MRIPQVVTATLPCKDDGSAVLLANYINETFGDGATSNGRHVTLPIADVTAGPVLDQLILHATQQGWSLGAEMALAAADFLDRLPALVREA